MEADATPSTCLAAEVGRVCFNLLGPSCCILHLNFLNSRQSLSCSVNARDSSMRPVRQLDFSFGAEFCGKGVVPTKDKGRHKYNWWPHGS